MNPIFYVNPNLKHHQDVAIIFGKGFKSIGINMDIEKRSPADGVGGFTLGDIALFWGYRDIEMIEHYNVNGKDVLIIELPFIHDRSCFKYFSIGINGLNGNANWLPCLDNGDRFMDSGIELHKPIKEDKEKTVIIAGQVPGDLSLGGMDFSSWLKDAYYSLKGADIFCSFRKHPNCKSFIIPKGLPVITGDVSRTFRAARAIITYSSNLGVLSVLQGIPTVSYSRCSMVYSVTNHSFYPPYKNAGFKSIVDWSKRIAWADWSAEEIISGFALSTIIGGIKNAKPI